MNAIINNINNWLIKYLHQSGDSEEILMQKKIWWLFNVAGLPFLILMSIIVGDKKGDIVVFLNFIWIFSILLSLLIFNLHKNNIQIFALATQIIILVLAATKVYLMGGLLNAGGVIYIGLIAPLYAITLPNKRHAIIIFILYMTSMFIATLLQPDNPNTYFIYYLFLGFFLGNTMAFIGLYYYTSQVERLKQEEKYRMRELDEFKTKFYTHITHEFRTPLTIILGMAGQIKKNPNKWSNEGLKMIKRNGQNLLNLTNQMLNLSKLEANAMPINLIQDDISLYLKYLVESFHSLAETKNIHLLFSAEPKEITMDFDQDKIQDILSNLLSNAIKFTPEEGLIQVSVSKEDMAPNSYLILKVKDSGVGIPPEHLHKVFDRYFQTENHTEQLTKGSGLGLALTKELVKLLKGEITLQSELYKGSTFIIRLPITNQASDVNIHLSKEIAFSGIHSKKNEQITYTYANELSKKLVLLIIEDNKDIVRYLHTLLSNDYQIEVASNGKEGFKKAVDIIPDLVISDVMMPVMDGFTFCEKLKNDLRTSHIPVVLLTARADAKSKMEGLKAGADVYLAKPFNQKELFIRIEKLIELRKAIQKRYKSIESIPILTKYTLNHKLPKEDIFIQKVQQTLELHICEEEFGIAELCRSMAMSRSQLYRKFAALTNITVHHFIRKLRLIKAKELLLNSELNVTEVAYDTGFKNLSHFSRVYSEEFGIAPSKVKR